MSLITINYSGDEHLAVRFFCIHKMLEAGNTTSQNLLRKLKLQLKFVGKSTAKETEM